MVWPCPWVKVKPRPGMPTARPVRCAPAGPSP